MPLSCSVPMLGLAMVLGVASESSITFSVDITALMPMSDAQLRAMVSETTALWKPHGVTFTWITGPRHEAPIPGRTLRVFGDGCQLEPLCRPTSMSRSASHRRLGAVVFVEGNVTAENTLMMSVDTVTHMVENAPWQNRFIANSPANLRGYLVGRALGRVLAHEIGHVLLASPSHTPDGLMRPELRVNQLIEAGRQGFALSKRLLPLLRYRLSQLAPHEAPGDATSTSVRVEETM